MDLRSPLSKAKGLGSAGEGVHHWWMQRLTALALIPLVIWFVCLVIKAASGDVSIIELLQSPFNAILMITFIGTALYHGNLGFKVIIEDYVHCPCGRNFILIATSFFTAITAIAVIVSVINVHVNGITDKKIKDIKASDLPEKISVIAEPENNTRSNFEATGSYYKIGLDGVVVDLPGEKPENEPLDNVENNLGN